MIRLEDNHRQGKDKVYGDLLNRVRTGSQTAEDVALPKTRVRPKDDPSLYYCYWLKYKDIMFFLGLIGNLRCFVAKSELS